jgi:hypothetical protein
MDSYKIEFRRGLIMIQSLDYSNNPKTRKIYSHMIIADKGLKYKNMKVKDIKINNWKVKQECKEQRTYNNAKLSFQL